MRYSFILPLLLAGIQPVLAAPEARAPLSNQTPPALWKDYDPDQGDFKEEIVAEQTRDGITSRDSYISAYVLGEEIRVYCRYSVKAGSTRAPGVLNVHGWMGAANVNRAMVEAGWAALAHDYCGKTGDRKHYTRYPERLRHGNMDRQVGPPVHAHMPDGKPIAHATQSSDYLWYAIQRRALSYLERQKEVDKTRLGATGYSYGGTIMWNLATDPRVKAVVAYFGIGWNVYYRDKQVWMYNRPYVEPPRSSGEEIYLAALAPQAHVPHIRSATLFLNGSNDHHGGHERGLESFKLFRPGVPRAFAVQARGHHNTDQLDQNARMWLDKHVLGKEVFWPDQPAADIRLDDRGVPRLVVRPASPARVTRVQIYYALKEPCSYARSWRDAGCDRNGETWAGSTPVIDVDDYLFAYANVTYDTTLVLSTPLQAAIPSRLGPAKATDKPSTVIYTGADGAGVWTNSAQVEGPKGVKGLRARDNRGIQTEQLYDPKWKAPAGGRLGFTFYCTQPQTFILTAGDHNTAEIHIPASDDWQEMAIPAGKLVNRFSKKPMTDWTKVGKIQFTPKEGSDLTKVIFARFTWTQ